MRFQEQADTRHLRLVLHCIFVSLTTNFFQWRSRITHQQDIAALGKLIDRMKTQTRANNFTTEVDVGVNMNEETIASFYLVILQPYF